MKFIKFFLVFISVTGSLASAQEAPKTRGNAFNPDIGLNALFLYRNSRRDSDPMAAIGKNGFSVQEGELQLTSDVDPYLRASALLAFSEGPTGWEIEPEELYGETLGLSLMTLRFGKFKALINKHNTLHAHAYPFIDAPLINTELLGDEGLNEAGVAAALLLPTSWFLELTVQVMNGDDKNLWSSPGTGDNGAVMYLDNMFDLNDDLTLQVGGSYTQGQNLFEGITRTGGGDLTVKWKPVGDDSVRTLKWANHFLYADAVLDPFPGFVKQGITSYLQWQGGQRWWLQARTEHFSQIDAGQLSKVKRKNSVLYAFTPSEFSAVRFQADRYEDGTEPVDDRFMVQLNFSIGAHPAHQY